MIQGRNFTEYTECVVNGVVQTTRWLTDNLLECHFSPQDFAPLAYSGDRLAVRLFERNLYLNLQQAEFYVLLLNQPFVYKVEPQVLFTQSSARVALEVHVSNEFDASGDNPADKFLFCKIADDIVVKVTQIRRN